MKQEIVKRFEKHYVKINLEDGKFLKAFVDAVNDIEVLLVHSGGALQTIQISDIKDMRDDLEARG